MSRVPAQRTRRVAGLAGLLGTAVLLVAGKAATAPPTHRIVLATPTPTPTSRPSPAPLPGRSTTSHPAATRAAAPPAPRTVLGRPENNPYGVVQVRLTLVGTRITDVRAVQLPSGGRSSEIAAYAAPQLRSEVLAAQSASIDSVSGASYDSEGYARSVQSALDAAPR
jgi:uncharacterized protein with FMN-binding domain